MEYKASLDSLTKGLTAVILLLLMAGGYKSVKVIWDTGGDTRAILVHGGLLLFSAGLLLGSWLYAPKSYIVGQGALTIHRPIGDVKIRLDEIKLVRVLSDYEASRAIRTFGVGGLFGYFGKFYIPGIGHATLYATRKRNKILIMTDKGKKLIITPDDVTLVDRLKRS